MTCTAMNCSGPCGCPRGACDEAMSRCPHGIPHRYPCEVCDVTAQQAETAEPQPIATLHDDGYFTWKNNDFRLKYHSPHAGWRMDVYAGPVAQQPQGERCKHGVWSEDHCYACEQEPRKPLTLTQHKRIRDEAVRQVVSKSATIDAAITWAIDQTEAAHGIGEGNVPAASFGDKEAGNV